MSQCERIILYIKQFGSITVLEAFQDIGCTRLSARISELKKAGYSFEADNVKAKNRYGQTVHYKRYRLTNTEN